LIRLILSQARLEKTIIMSDNPSSIQKLISEIKRRKVFRVGLVYVVGAWVLLQVAEVTFEPLNLPEWAMTFLIVLVIVGFALAIVLAWALEITPEGIKKTRPEQKTKTLDEPDGSSIAVLPFVDMSPDKDQDYFCEGMAEEIINALTSVKGVHVASRTASFQFKGETTDIREIGERLNVNTVLEGSVRKAGERLRVMAQLIKVKDGYHIWSEGYDRDLRDVFAIQKEIAENIVQAFQLTLSPTEEQAIKISPTSNVEAYDYYLRGRKFFYQHSRQGFNQAREMFSRAIELDPGYALAHAGLADCFASIYMYADSSVSNRLQAETASRLALELDPKLAQAHASRGLALSLSKRYEEAEQAFEAAIRLDPKLFEAYYFYARDSLAQGNFEKAVTSFEAACRVRPEDYQSPALLAQAYIGLGRKEEAVKAKWRALDLIETHLERNPEDARALYLGAAGLIELGKTEQGLDWASRALAMGPDDALILYNVACVYSHAGAPDLALDCLERSVARGMAHKEWMEHDTDLDPLRDQPRFKALLEAGND
jgi:TolB-like protein/Flp pilus assembly protein TadD